MNDNLPKMKRSLGQSIDENRENIAILFDLANDNFGNVKNLQIAQVSLGKQVELLTEHVKKLHFVNRTLKWKIAVIVTLTSLFGWTLWERTKYLHKMINELKKENSKSEEEHSEETDG